MDRLVNPNRTTVPGGSTQGQRRGCRGDGPVDVAPHTATGDGQPELIAIRPVALAGAEIEPGPTQPAHRQILEAVPDREDPQRLAIEPGTVVSGRTGELELQRPLTMMSAAEPRALPHPARVTSLSAPCCGTGCKSVSKWPRAAVSGRLWRTFATWRAFE